MSGFSSDFVQLCELRCSDTHGCSSLDNAEVLPKARPLSDRRVTYEGEPQEAVHQRPRSWQSSQKRITNNAQIGCIIISFNSPSRRSDVAPVADTMFINRMNETSLLYHMMPNVG